MRHEEKKEKSGLTLKISNEVIGRQECDFTTAHMTGLVVAVWLSARPETCKNAAEPVRFSPAEK